MANKRAHISLATMLASAICELLAIPHEHAQAMTDEQAISLVHRDHYPVRRDDGLKMGMSVEEVDHHSNLKLRSIMVHRDKTATIDQPQIAKNKRIRKTEAVHKAAMAMKAGRIDVADETLRAIADPKRRQPKKKIAQRVNPWPPKGSRSFERRAR